MLRGRLTLPDLDDLESPLVSPTHLNRFSVPGSAIAEKIFNDPDSWDDNSGDEGEYPEDIENDTLAWLTEEIEKFRVQSAGVGADGHFDLPRQEKKKNTKDVGLFPKREGNGGWREIARRSGVRPISLAALFEQPNDEFSQEIQQHLSKILDSSGIRHRIRPRPASATLSSPYSSGAVSSSSTSDSISTSSTYATSIGENPPLSSAIPPSATLSFLEYYGIYPDTPLVDGRKSLLPRKKTLRRTPQYKDQASRSGSLSATTASFPSPLEPPMQTAPMRFSSGPPPGLEPPSQTPKKSPTPGLRINPPGLSQPRLPSGARSQSLSPSDSRNDTSDQEIVFSSPPRSEHSPRNRPLPTTAPLKPVSPDWTTPSTPPVRIRRLPSIPLEVQPAPKPEPAPQTIVKQPSHPPPQPVIPRSAAFSPPAKSSAGWSFGSASPLARSAVLTTPQGPTAMRPPSAVRSPLSVPLGPRTRSRSSGMQPIQPY